MSISTLSRAEAVARMHSIRSQLETIEKRDNLTDADGIETKKLTAEFEALDDHREGLERREMLRKIQGDPNYRIVPGSDNGGDYNPYPAMGGSTRDVAMRMIDGHVRSGALPAGGAERVEKLLNDGPVHSRSMAAKWATATGSDAYLRAFSALVADPERGHLMWTPEELEAYRSVAAVQGEMRSVGLGAPSNGSFMVPLTMDPSILVSNDGTDSGIRSMARVVQTATGSWSGVTSAGVTASWLAEGAENTDDSPTLGQPVIPVHKGSAFVPFTIEYGMDAVNATSELSRLLADAAANLMGSAYATGSGSGQPKGVITALTGTSSEIAGAGTEAIVAADAFNLQNALGPRFQQNARFGMNLAIKNAFAQLETTNGAVQFPELRMSPPSLLSRPVTEVSDFDGAIDPAVTASNMVAVYGDWSSFVIVDQIGTSVELIPHVFGANQRPTGTRALYMFFRSGSDVVTPNGLRMLNVATTA